MKKQIKYFLLGFIIILLSAPIGNELNKIVGQKLMGDAYSTLLNGFIHSIMLTGLLIIVIGLVDVIVNKDKNIKS